MFRSMDMYCRCIELTSYEFVPRWPANVMFPRICLFHSALCKDGYNTSLHSNIALVGETLPLPSPTWSASSHIKMKIPAFAVMYLPSHRVGDREIFMIFSATNSLQPIIVFRLDKTGYPSNDTTPPPPLSPCQTIRALQK
jgi:hypothetical protein